MIEVLSSLEEKKINDIVEKIKVSNYKYEKLINNINIRTKQEANKKIKKDLEKINVELDIIHAKKQNLQMISIYRMHLENNTSVDISNLEIEDILKAIKNIQKKNTDEELENLFYDIYYIEKLIKVIILKNKQNAKYKLKYLLKDETVQEIIPLIVDKMIDKGELKGPSSLTVENILEAAENELDSVFTQEARNYVDKMTQNDLDNEMKDKLVKKYIEKNKDTILVDVENEILFI